MITNVRLPLSLLLLTAIAAQADVNYNIARDQAKSAAGKSQAASGGGQSSGQAPPGQQQPPMDPALAATLKNINSLRDDFAAICTATNAAAAAEQKVSLLNNLTAAAQGAKASSANVKKLAGEFMTSLPAHPKISPQSTKLARNVHALFNGAHLNATQQETLLNDVKKILTDAGVSEDDAVKIADDLKAVAAETK